MFLFEKEKKKTQWKKITSKLLRCDVIEFLTSNGRLSESPSSIVSPALVMTKRSNSLPVSKKCVTFCFAEIQEKATICSPRLRSLI
jgi:hypothetical protein